MAEMNNEVLQALNSDEASALIAEYVKLFLEQKYPDHVDDAEYVKMATAAVIGDITGATPPAGVDAHTFVLNSLRTSINDLRTPSSAITKEEIPPRPVSNGSRYLDPAEVEWLLKYDSKVKYAAEGYVLYMISEHFDSCDRLSDEQIIDNGLKMLYKLNRRAPEIVARIPGAGPSFFKQYEEGTPEEILIRYFDSQCDYKTSGSSSHSADPAAKEKAKSEKDRYLFLGIVFLIFFWPVGIYFLYKAYKLKAE